MKHFNWKKILASVAAVSCLLSATVIGASAAAPKTTSQFSVGAAVRDITPSYSMLPLTRAPRVEMVGVLDPLSVRAIALSDANTTMLMVCSETGRSFGPQFADAIAEHTGLPLENILLTSTHTHAAPEITETLDLDFDSKDPEVTNLQKWAKFALEQTLDAVDEALENREAASVGIEYGESYINVNRNSPYTEVDQDGNVTGEGRNLGWDPSGISDKTVAAVRFNDQDGDPIAFIINYSVHGTVMHANTCINGKTGISADIPGIVSGYLEDSYDGAVAMWLSGAAGDQNPIIQNDLYTPSVETGAFEEVFNNDYAILTFLSKIHFADVQRTLNKIDTYTSDVTLQCGYSETTIPSTEEGQEFGVTLQMMRIGDLGLACFPGELFTSTGLYMQENALLDDTLIVNHSWQREEQNNGYHADDWTIENGGFGQRQAKYQPGYLNDALVGMMNEFYEDTGAWLYNADGTATYSTTGELTIVGVDGKAGTADDNQVVNPAGKALMTNVVPKFDEKENPYIELGNGFVLTPGADKKIGTTDDEVAFGTYLQSEHEEVEASPLAWNLLDITDGKAIMATTQIIDAVQFNKSDKDGNEWADSNLRSWLNSRGGESVTGDKTGFYNTAFSAEDKAKIVTSKVSMTSDTTYEAYNRLVKENWWGDYTTNTGKDTEDYVYALSGEEVFEYYGPSLVATLEELGHDPHYYTNAMCAATAYAVKNGIAVNGGGNGPSYIGFADSWTRSPGAVDESGETSCGVFLGSVGSLNVGRSVTRSYGARPVITVDLKG